MWPVPLPSGVWPRVGQKRSAWSEQRLTRREDVRTLGVSPEVDMNTPMVQAIHPNHDLHIGHLEPSDVVFRVVRTGLFEGRLWREGDHVVCRPGARYGGPVVLVPRGKGRPMLGRQDGLRLTGVHGEPCHPARWAPSGRVVRVVRGHTEVAREQRGTRRQLALFGEVAA